MSFVQIASDFCYIKCILFAMATNFGDTLAKLAYPYSLTFNEQVQVHFKNWTLQFKLLYLSNHVNCFDETAGYVG